MQGRIALLIAALVLGAPGAALARNFDAPASHDTSQQFAADNPQRHDTPNDPSYDYAETDDEDAPGVTPSNNLYDEDFSLFGFPSQRTRGTTTYHEGPNSGKPQISGFNAAGAWKLTRGEPSVSIAILDTGVKWDRVALRRKIRLNTGELPKPQHDRITSLEANQPLCATYTDAYDANGDGAVNVVDWSCDSRVSATGGPHGSPQIDAEDLIAAFSDGTDADGNGYTDDIAGWDFFDDDNDPFDASSYFAAANHGSGRAGEAGGEANDGDGSPGVCPKCQLVPLRVWDTFVSDQISFAMAVLYATDNGVKVIEGADGGLYHSAFAEAATKYAYAHDVTQTYSGDDLNTGNHNYPANYDHTMLIQGTVPDTVGLGTSQVNPLTDFINGLSPTGPVCCNLPVGTYFRGAGTTQYGGHSSIAMEGATGSENTGKAAGAAGMVYSAGVQRGLSLHADEVREIIEQTAEDVTGGSTGVDGNVAGVGAPDQAQPGWDPHFGWGRVDLGAAVSLADSGKIPPEASIGSPDWYAPLTGASVPISGRALARFATGRQFHWKLEWGPGLAPTSWNTASEGDSTGAAVTSFGSIDLNAVRAALASYTRPNDPGMPTFAPGGTDPYKGQFAVRLTVTGAGIPTPGVDRKVLTAIDDPTLHSGFPKRTGAGGEAPLQYADLTGDNQEELIVPLEDGTVHVYRKDGSELPGWPRSTGVQHPAENHDSAPGIDAIGPPREPPRGVAVADLDDDGVPELITTAGQHIYAWEPDGSVRPGFPVAIDRNFCKPQDNSQPLVHRKCGFLASPSTGRLEGKDKPLDIVVAALDGHVYAVRGDGSALPGFPRELVDPNVAPGQQMKAESINNVAVADLNGDGKDDVVAASNEVYGASPPNSDDVAGLFATALAKLLANVTDTSTRVYAIDGSNGSYLPGWPITLNGGIQNVLPFIGPGHDPSVVTVGGEKRVVASATGGALAEYGADGSLKQGIQQGTQGGASNATDKTASLNLFESASIGDVLGTGQPSVVKYQTTVAASANLLLVGQNFPWQHLIGAFDANTGAPLPAFPTVTDDYQFLSSSTVAKMQPGQTNQIVAGTGLGLLHAYDGLTGLDITGFPKVTGGWLFAPAALAADGRMAGITREGYMFEWGTQAAKCQPEWPDFRHDPQHTGNYNGDGRAPGAPTDLALAGDDLTFTAPGDDGLCGTAARYDVVRSDNPIDAANFGAAEHVAGAPAPAAAGTKQSAPAGAGKRYYAVRAVDEAGNVGWLATLDATTQPAAGGGTGGSGGGDTGGGGLPGGGNPGDTTGGGGGGSSSTACATAAGFRTASATGKGSALRIAFERRSTNPVTVDVFASAAGRHVTKRDQAVAHFANRRSSFTWNGRANKRGRKVVDGYYFVRIQTRDAASRLDVRRVTLRRRHGRWTRVRGFYGGASCGLLQAAKLSRPVFGGTTKRPIVVAFKVAKRSAVTIELLRGRKVVRRIAVRAAGAGRTTRRGVSARGLRAAAYTFRIKATSGAETDSATLSARRL
ncbi:MAG: hypothetical protein QOJ07_1112 [Thermoleophilaceae bacterium]|nr:hypothetical protein [Thermoleophilaceae bacterium]